MSPQLTYHNKKIFLSVKKRNNSERNCVHTAFYNINDSQSAANTSYRP